MFNHKSFSFIYYAAYFISNSSNASLSQRIGHSCFHVYTDNHQKNYLFNALVRLNEMLTLSTLSL